MDHTLYRPSGDLPRDSRCSQHGSLDRMVLEHLIEPPACSGTVRKATLADLDLIVDWKCTAIREAVGEEPVPARVRETTLGQLERGMVWLMESQAGEPVSMANCSQAGQGLRIGGVYTQPEHRGHGCCQNTVAALCRDVLAQGYQSVTLLVDRENPVSKRVYRKLGFVVLEDSKAAPSVAAAIGPQKEDEP